MVKRIVFIFLVLSWTFAKAQSDSVAVIKIEKSKNLVQGQYDNVNQIIVALDKYGIPHTDVVKSFDLYYKVKRKTYHFQSFSNKLTPEMLEALSKLESAQKIFFTNITAEDKHNTLVKLPDVIDVHFPNCALQKNKKKR